MKALTGEEKLLSSGDYLAVVRDFALSKGVAPEILLNNAEVDLQDLINPPALVPNLIVNRVGVNLYHALENKIAAAAEFGLRMTVASHGSLGLAVQCAESLSEAYQILKTFYHTRINSQDVQISDDQDVTHIHLINMMEAPSLIPEIQGFFDLATLVSIATNTYEALETDKLEGRIRLCINAPKPEQFPATLLRGVETVFDHDKLELQIPLSWRDARLKVANPELAKAARERCLTELQRLDPQDLAGRVLTRLRAREDAMPALNDIAAEFYMSPATFKRRLRELGYSYQDLKNQVRLQRATSLLLEEGESIEATAFKLGFSDASNFTKSFKAWTGQTPKAFLLKHR